MDFKTCVEALKNSHALQRGKLVLSEEFVTEEVEKQLDTPLVRKVDLTFARQHCMVDMNVGRAGLLYRWASSFALRSFDLNTDDRHVLFEQAEKVRVGPANLAAKAVRLAPSLIPDVEPTIGPVIKCVIRISLDRLVEALINSHVRSSVEESGFEVEAPLWRYNLSSGRWERHPVFTPIDLPVLGKWTLVGDVVVVRRVDFQNGEISLRLDLHPSFKKAARHLGFDWHEVLDDGNSGPEEETASEDPSRNETDASPTGGGLFNMFSPAKLKKIIGENQSTPAAQVVDEEWKTAIQEAPVLEPNDLGLDGAEALEVLDFLEL